MEENIKCIADHFKLDAQELKAVEECMELAQAILKHRGERTVETWDHVMEEIADVEIMIAQIKYLMEGNDAVWSWRKYKIERTLQRISDSK